MKAGQRTVNEKSVLIIDDEEGLRNILSSRLIKMGFKVDVAANGMHALQKLKSGFNPSIVICDLKMPGMNGFEFMKALRDDMPTNPIPIIVITAFPEKELMQETRRLGVKSVLIKPFSFQDIVDKIVGDLGIAAAS